MASVIEKNGTTLFPPQVVQELFNAVRGKSSLAKLSGKKPIPFAGIREFTFSFDSEVDIVAESGAKSNGGAEVTPVTIIPIKFEYGTRVSDEYLYASDEEKIETLRAFSEAFARKLARGLDIAAFQGNNPRTGSASAVVGTNNFDSAVTNSVTYVNTTPDANLEAAIALVQGGGFDATGLAASQTFASDMAAVVGANGSLYPDFLFGNSPERFYGMNCDVNGAMTTNSSKLRAIVGDFENAFKWGFAKDVTLEVIRYGNPDNDAVAGDLRGHNQVYLRAEAYLGWGILAPAAFAKIKTT